MGEGGDLVVAFCKIYKFDGNSFKISEFKKVCQPLKCHFKIIFFTH